MYQNKKKKAIHISIIVSIIVILIFSFLIAMIFYEVEGEKKLPFNISKVSVVSSIEGIDKQVEGYSNAKDVNQNNDIYIYIAKNENYKETEVIKNIVLDNFTVNKQNGQYGIYELKGTAEDMLKTKEENKTNKITFTGVLEPNLNDMQISNQGGIIVFRYSNLKVSEFLSNEIQELTNEDLLKLTNVNEEDLKATISFDLTINLESNTSFRTTLIVDVPISGIVNEGKTKEENVDLGEIKFKRVENKQ